MNAIANYWSTLLAACGAGWRKFWFTPADPAAVSGLRVLVGLASVYYFLSFLPDLSVWFGPAGLVPIDLVQQLTASESGGWNGRFSHLLWREDPAWLWGTHAVCLALAVAYTVGLGTRITGGFTTLAVLSYVHRAPLITGPLEPLLTFLLLYLWWAPAGAYFSVDRWLLVRREARTGHKSSTLPAASVAANLSQRLIQVHVSGFYLMLALTKLGGSDVWWDGSAMWWLLAHSESRLVDWTFLHTEQRLYLVDLWTHGIVMLELGAGLLLWRPLWRPLLLVLLAIHWLLLGLVTGLLGFAGLMMIASLAFLPPATFQQRLVRA